MTEEVRRTFLADVKWLGLAQLALRAKGLVVLPFLTRELGVVDYGVWSQVAIVTAFAAPLINWGTAFGFVRRKAGTPIAERERFFSAWIYAVFAAFAAVFAVTMAVSEPIAGYLMDSPSQGPVLIALALTFALTGGIFNAEINWLRVNGESRVHALTLFAQAGLSLTAIVTYLVVGGSVVFLVALTVAADALLVLGLFVRYLLQHGWARPDFPSFWAAFRYGLPLAPLAFAMIGINWADRLVLLRYLTIADVGIYNLVHGITLMAVQSVSHPVRTYYPARATAYYNAGKMEELQALYGLSAGTLFAVQVPAAIGIFFVAPVFLAIMAPPEFAAGAQVLPLLFLGYAIDWQGIYNQQIFEWQYRQHWVTISLCGCFALSLLLNILLVPRFGILGAGIANVTAFSARYLFVFLMVRGHSPHRSSGIFVLKILVAGAIMGATLWLLPQVMPGFQSWNVVVQFLLLVVTGAATYFAALFALGVIAISGVRTALRWAAGS